MVINVNSLDFFHLYVPGPTKRNEPDSLRVWGRYIYFEKNFSGNLDSIPA